MLQDIAPHIYDNAMAFPGPGAEDWALVYREGSALLAEQDGQLLLPRVGQCVGQARWVYAFAIDGERYFLDLGQAQAPGFAPRRLNRTELPRHRVFAVSVGQSLSRWYGDNRFCGTCGRPMEHSRRERAMVCPECGRTAYPKICPGVIAAVHDGDRLLLTRYAGRAFKLYALVAGFCEIGETVEETVHREVLEETGLRVKNLRFYKSQPWVISDTLLFGFFAELDGSDRVCLQEDELSEGRWFRREELPREHSADSLTGEMIEFFRAGCPGF